MECSMIRSYGTVASSKRRSIKLLNSAFKVAIEAMRRPDKPSHLIVRILPDRKFRGELARFKNK